MEDGRILDDQISVSENPDIKGESRLLGPGGNTDLTWQPTFPTNSVDRWIQVDLSVQRLITGVIIQGRKRAHPNDGLLQYVTVFTVQFGNDGISFENLAFLADDLVRYSLSVRKLLHEIDTALEAALASRFRSFGPVPSLPGL